MARRTITRVLCDVCLSRDVETEGTETPPLSYGDFEPQVLALCPDHWSIFQNFTEALAWASPQVAVAEVQEESAPAEPEAVETDSRPLCPECGKQYKNTKTLASHRRQAHSVYARGPRVTARIEDKPKKKRGRPRKKQVAEAA